MAIPGTSDCRDFARMQWKIKLMCVGYTIFWSGEITVQRNGKGMLMKRERKMKITKRILKEQSGEGKL
jgi:hypothetical protein